MRGDEKVTKGFRGVLVSTSTQSQINSKTYILIKLMNILGVKHCSIYKTDLIRTRTQIKTKNWVQG